jgi:transposase
MLESLHLGSDHQGHTVVLDAGLASEENIQWLKNNSYRYIVVSRERYKERPELADGAVIVKDKIADQVMAKRVIDPDSNEVRLYCHSEKREAKDSAIRSQFASRYEAQLNKLHAGLSKKGTVKRYEKVVERLGRLKEKHARVAGDYTLEVQTNAEKTVATAIVWQRQKSADEKDSLSGVYCLRSNDESLDEQALWKTYVMLTDVEASFRSMKSELGLRPIYHQKEERVSAHLFITLLAYHLVHTLRRQLQEKGISLSWASIRNIMATQQRMTVSLLTAEQHSIHVRTTSKPEPMQQTIFNALNIRHDAVGMKKTIIPKKE